MMTRFIFQKRIHPLFFGPWSCAAVQPAAPQLTPLRSRPWHHCLQGLKSYRSIEIVEIVVNILKEEIVGSESGGVIKRIWIFTLTNTKPYLWDSPRRKLTNPCKNRN